MELHGADGWNQVSIDGIAVDDLSTWASRCLGGSEPSQSSSYRPTVRLAGAGSDPVVNSALQRGQLCLELPSGSCRTRPSDGVGHPSEAEIHTSDPLAVPPAVDRTLAFPSASRGHIQVSQFVSQSLRLGRRTV